jgi:hypothetical protein
MDAAPVEQLSITLRAGAQDVNFLVHRECFLAALHRTERPYFDTMLTEK